MKQLHSDAQRLVRGQFTEKNTYILFHLSKLLMTHLVLWINPQDGVLFFYHHLSTVQTFKMGVSCLSCYRDFIFKTFFFLHRVNAGPALSHPRAQDHRPGL